MTGGRLTVRVAAVARPRRAANCAAPDAGPSSPPMAASMRKRPPEHVRVCAGLALHISAPAGLLAPLERQRVLQLRDGIAAEHGIARRGLKVGRLQSQVGA